MSGLIESIRREFLREGVRTARQLAESVDHSQPTISRALADMGDAVVRIGRGASTQYGLAAPIESLGSRWPLYVINEAGEPQQLGRLHALAGRAWYLERTSADAWESLLGDDFGSGVFPDLPWFLDDTRPQGFLGRAFARRFGPSMGFPADPTRWSSPQVAQALLQHGWDLPGAFVLGMDALKGAFLSDEPALVAGQRDRHFPQLAQAALEGDIVGSSAGGEQPKFTAKVREGDTIHHVIVKFTGVMTQPEHQRWADLLAAEHLATEVLASGGIPAARSRVVDFDGRRFLEVERFDRVGAAGRRPVVSMRALDAAFFGEIHTPWTAAADRLENAGWIRSSDAENLRTLWHFGELIGNTDMHYGNVSLELSPRRPISLCPVYDMLPMGYRPGHEGRLPESLAQDPSRTAISDRKARRMATIFWERVVESSLISGDFRDIARRHLVALEQVERTMPAFEVERMESLSEPAARRQDPRTYENRSLGL
mgnify:CR=1 FL=1|jgi:Uncharacterized protein related to capsule biosynthesis enzymes